MNIRQKQGGSFQIKFESYCNNKNIEFIPLDSSNRNVKENFLKDPNGMCPDYLCMKNNKSIFVEVKTHTILTNESRNKQMTQAILAKKSSGPSGTTIFLPFDPTPELTTPFKGYLRKAGKKFKNIKDQYNFPTVLLLDGIHIEQTDINRIFAGFNWDVDKEKFCKTHQGLLDSTGSNVSAIVYWVDDLSRYLVLANGEAKVLLLETDSRDFF